MRVGVISGHKIGTFIDNVQEIDVKTPYGSVTLWYSKKNSREVFFVNRHGKNADDPPHMVSYRAIIHALKVGGVDSVLSIGTVGSLNPSIKAGDFVIPHDFIDFTKSRNYTFYDNKRVHVDMSNPLCPSLRRSMVMACRELSQKCHEKGIYLATEGPRLETPAEIKMFSGFADVVGMTLVPEAILAREKEMCYASLCLVCNMAAGLQNVLTAEEIAEVVAEKRPVLEKILIRAVEEINEDRNCTCRKALERAML